MHTYPMDCSTRITSPTGELWQFDQGVPAKEVNDTLPREIRGRLLSMIILALGEMLSTPFELRPNHLVFEVEGWTVTLWREPQ